MSLEDKRCGTEGDLGLAFPHGMGDVIESVRGEIHSGTLGRGCGRCEVPWKMADAVFATCAPIWAVLFVFVPFERTVEGPVLRGLGLCGVGGAALVAQGLALDPAHAFGNLLVSSPECSSTSTSTSPVRAQTGPSTEHGAKFSNQNFQVTIGMSSSDQASREFRNQLHSVGGGSDERSTSADGAARRA